MQIGNHIRAARLSRKLSQAQFGRLLDVAQIQVWRWEDDARLPRLSKLCEMADVLETTLDALVRGKRKKKRSRKH